MYDRGNVSSNKRISTLTQIPHLGYTSHKLNLEVCEMINKEDDINETIMKIKETMKAAKGKLKNAAILHDLTDTKPVLDSDTRWSGKVYMPRQFNKLKAHIVKAVRDEKAEIPVDTTPLFAAKPMKYQKMLDEIDFVTKSIENNGRKLAEFRGDLDILIEASTLELFITHTLSVVQLSCRTEKL